MAARPARAWAVGVDFDETEGPRVAWLYPRDDADAVGAMEREVPFVALAENTSSIEATAQERSATRFLVATAEGRTLFGASVMRSDFKGARKRGARQRAVAVLSAFPAWDLLEEKVLALSVLALDEDGAAGAAGAARDLVGAVAARAPERCGGSGDFASCCALAPLTGAVGYDAFCRLVRVAALGGRVCVFAASPAAASLGAAALASAMPAFLSLGVARGLEDLGAGRLHARAFGWRRRGFPLLTADEWAFQPLLSMATATTYLPPGALEKGGGPSESGYLVGTANAMVALRLGASADAVVDLDAGTVAWGGGALAAAARASDKRVEGLAKTLAESHRADDDVAVAAISRCAFRGGDDWARSAIAEALSASLLSCEASSRPPLLRAFTGPDFHDALRRSAHVKRRPKKEVSVEPLPAEAPRSDIDDDEEVYEGDRDLAGRRHGRGKCASAAYSYDGAWCEDAAHGVGRLITPKFVYEGDFKRGVFHGSGDWAAVGGALKRYRGEFQGGEFHGAGKFECDEVACPRPDPKLGPWTGFVGEFRRGDRHGVGTCAYASGAVWSGDWVDGRATGEGRLIEADGTTFSGEFVDGVLEGPATMTTPGGDEFDGTFKGGAFDEAETWTVKYADGRRFFGRLKDGVPTGSGGIMKYADGDVYEGSFRDGLRSGRGRLLRGDGSTRSGDWRCDLLVRDDAKKGTYYESPAARKGAALAASDDDFGFESGSGDDDDDDGDIGDPASPDRFRDVRGGASDAIFASPPRAHEVSTAPRRGRARVRYPNGDVYDGWFARGVRDGAGVFEEALTGHTYDGDWRRGLRHGRGDFRSGDGEFFYSGEWKEGAKCGQGTATLRGKVSFAGGWRKDAFHGFGTLVDSAGNRYAGEFHDGAKTGVGEQTYADGSVYKGEWRAGCREGTGHVVKPDGESYSGDWFGGLPHGTGVLTRADGSSHAGGFVEGRAHGWGVAKTADEERECDFVRGEAVEDDVKIAYASGRHYVGSTLAGLPHGSGVSKWPSGETYSGSWVRGKRAGRGVGCFPSGESFDGDWQDDHPALAGTGILTSASGKQQTFAS